MKRDTALSAGALRSAAVRGALALATISALFLTGLLAPGATEGTGPFNVNGRVSKLLISYEGGCQPGAAISGVPQPGRLAAKLSSTTAIGGGTTVTINLVQQNLSTVGDVYGCVGTAAFPFTLLVESELFSAANVNTVTTDWLSASEQPTFSLEVEDCLGTEFPSSGQIYVGAELMTYTGKTCNGPADPPDTFNITARAVTRPGGPATAKAGHAIGSLVRAQGMLVLLERALPKYTGGTATGPAQHDLGSLVQSPTTYLTCRAALTQISVTDGPDSVTSRSRCYPILEPGYNPPSAPFWPDPPDPNMPLTGLIPVFYHDISTGTINESTGQILQTPSTLRPAR